ncbi:hypothetical protein BRC91_07955 [Halobacteriales archaeon QS_4_62_28]|nr:MAG: hypothetical protein BRC91_07955 [Halobacteriales archaeon QS_4_62_28]
MSEDDSLNDLDGRRDYPRVALVAVALLAIVLATTAVPALSPAGADSPISSAVPIPEQMKGGSGGSGGSGSAGGLGALSPGEQTGVGGSLGGESALRSQSDEVHFRVQATEESYWRTGAYSEYDGEGWSHRSDTTPVDGRIPVPGQRGREVTYEVTLDNGATALPTVWQPASISREGIEVTANGAIHAGQSVPEGTTYTGVSYQPPDDPAALRQAGQAYPDDIERRYTRLPSNSENRLKPFTDDLTANASSSYEKAKRIERWLESNKEYSLNASHNPDREAGVATQFVFDMETGYCEYFATSMVAMLRTQDIPARYVVGYSSGEQVGDNEYVVRGMNAHAWVEVYFPDVGWVRFDPTPGDERRQQESQSLGEETATPPQTQSATATQTATPTDTQTTTPSETSDDGYAISLNRTAVPGANVTVTVTDGDVPVADARVLFNGAFVGVTDTEGNVTALVPYAETLSISVDGAAEERVVSHGAPTRQNGRLFRIARPSLNASDTYDLNTTARLVLSGPVHTGGEVAVTALVDDQPVRQGTLSLDGEQVATTDDQGQATITLPDEPGSILLSVERGAVRGNRTITLGELTATVEPTTPLSIPFGDVTVNATIAGQPAAGAVVALDGETVATTGVDGTATVSLPVANSATITVSKYDQRATTTLTGLYRNALLLDAIALLVLGGVVALARRHGVTPRRIGHWFLQTGRLLVSGLIGLGGVLDTALARLRARATRTLTHLRALVTGRRSPVELVAALQAWLRVRLDATTSSATAVADTVSAATGTGGETPADAHTTVRDGWSQFLGHVSLSRPETRTPAAIGAHAIEDDDLPAAAVWTLIDAFRAVEYGQRDPSEQAPAVDEAVADIERALDETTAPDDEDPTGSGAGVAD